MAKTERSPYRPQVHYYSPRLQARLLYIRSFCTTFVEAPSGAGFLPGTVTGELVLDGTSPEGGGYRYLLRVTGRVAQGGLETSALTSLRYRLLEDVAERDVPLPEGGLRVKDMRVSEASPTPLRGGSGGGCNGGFGPLCLLLLPALGVLRRR